MNILVGCESSGVVRQAFRRRGHEAISCDILPPDDGKIEHHIQGDVFAAIASQKWDMLIAFPPCTHICSSGARWFREKRRDGRQQAAIEFFMGLVLADIPMIAIENPVGIMSSHYRKPDFILQPWQHGHGECKATCIWLRNLPVFPPTNIVEGRSQRIARMPPSQDRAKLRSITYQGVAEAMAAAWG